MNSYPKDKTSFSEGEQKKIDPKAEGYDQVDSTTWVKFVKTVYSRTSDVKYDHYKCYKSDTCQHFKTILADKG